MKRVKSMENLCFLEKKKTFAIDKFDDFTEMITFSI